jgi:hypothetical protein
MRTLIVTTLLCLLMPALAQAQTTTPAVVTQFQLLILPTTGDPLTVTPITTQTTTIGPTQNCGIDPAAIGTPPALSVNPLLYAMDDPFVAGKKCRLSFPTTLSAGNYRWAGVFIAATCTNAAGQPQTNCIGPRAVGQPPFSIANLLTAPGAPTGLMLLP